MSPFERVISSHEFEDLVVAHSHQTPVLVDFYADWCGPCHAFSPVLSEMARHCDGSFLLAKIDFDANKELAVQAGVRALPAIALFKDGKRVDGFSGGRLPHSLRFFLAKNGVEVPAEASAKDAS
ncbi:MAG: thioredoxin domain-containing protein [Pseudomonadota bacterium]